MPSSGLSRHDDHATNGRRGWRPGSAGPPRPHLRDDGTRFPHAEERAMAMLSFERKYRVRGGTLLGGDLFDFWVGPFYRRLLRRHHDVLRRPRHAADRLGRLAGPTWNLWQINIAPPDLSVRPGLAPLQEGGLWQIITICAHRRLRLLGAARGGDLPQARHRLSRAVRLRRRDLRLCDAGRDPPRAAGRLGPRLSLRHHQPSRLGVEHRLPVPALPLQPGAHARGELLLHDHLRALAARRADPVGDQPGARARR